MKRRQPHEKNPRLEELLRDVNDLLLPSEIGSIKAFTKSKYPLILIMGCPRSGTTLFLQWLASLGHFCYPTNILSRFYGAPYIGAKIQLMLTKHDFNNEIFDFNETVPFSSRLGKTKGALAPNEFWYFWRRFFNYGEIQILEADALKTVDHETFVSELAAMESVFDKPCAMKGMIANWNIPFLANILEKVLFVHIKRRPFYNIQSLLNARLDYYGSFDGWYSFKPPEYESLKDLTPYEQVSGQIYYTNEAIEKGLEKVGASRVLTVDYEEFCESPERFFEAIRSKLSSQGFERSLIYPGPAKFAHMNHINVTQEEVRLIIDAYRKFSGSDVTV
ncbi:MAG: sulfotransferase [Nitrospirae bacterium]|nr:sulfotransferase [Nitrospirota bacterium]